MARPIVLIPHLYRLADAINFRKDYSPPSSPPSRPYTCGDSARTHGPATRRGRGEGNGGFSHATAAEDTARAVGVPVCAPTSAVPAGTRQTPLAVAAEAVQQ